MPIYEYVCETCSQKFELLKSKMVKDSREKCPSCGGTAKQQLSAFGVGRASSPGGCEGPCEHTPCQTGGNCGSGGCPYSGM